MSMPTAYAYSPQQVGSQMPTYPAHFSPLVTRPQDAVAIASLNPGAREIFRSISPNPTLNLNLNPAIASTSTAAYAPSTSASLGFRSLASATHPVLAPAATITASSSFPPPPPPLPPARNGASALEFNSSATASIPKSMGSLPRAGFSAPTAAPDSDLVVGAEFRGAADLSNKSSPNSGSGSGSGGNSGTGSGSLSLTRQVQMPISSSATGSVLNQLSSIEAFRALSNSPAAERRAGAVAGAGAAGAVAGTSRKYSPSPIVTNTFI